MSPVLNELVSQLAFGDRSFNQTCTQAMRIERLAGQQQGIRGRNSGNAMLSPFQMLRTGLVALCASHQAGKMPRRRLRRSITMPFDACPTGACESCYRVRAVTPEQTRSGVASICEYLRSLAFLRLDSIQMIVRSSTTANWLALTAVQAGRSEP